MSLQTRLLRLNPGDIVDIIAPASRCSDANIKAIQALLSSWDLVGRVSPNMFGEDLLCANSDDMRFQELKQALLNPDSKAVICARGGYGSARLISALNQLNPPHLQKLFIGMSDITALHLFLQQHWQWPVIHGALSPDKFSAESIAAAKSILFQEVPRIEFEGLPLNAAAKQKKNILSTVSGGNLCLLQASIGTSWQLNADNKMILIEEINERAYRIDRMLEHLHQTNILKEAAAIIFADFLGGEEPDGSSLILPVLERFAVSCKMPVIKMNGIGHGYVNFPLPFGTSAELCLGDKIKLVCELKN